MIDVIILIVCSLTAVIMISLGIWVYSKFKQLKRDAIQWLQGPKNIQELIDKLKRL